MRPYLASTINSGNVPIRITRKTHQWEKIKIAESNGKARTYYASVEQRNDALYMLGSRAVAFLGIGDSLEEAEKIAEEGASSVKGKVFHRKDIGTKALIGKRVEHAKRILG